MAFFKGVKFHRGSGVPTPEWGTIFRDGFGATSLPRPFLGPNFLVFLVKMVNSRLAPHFWGFLVFLVIFGRLG